MKNKQNQKNKNCGNKNCGNKKEQHEYQHGGNNDWVKKSLPKPTKTALSLVGDCSKTDVNGSYTGIPVDKKEKPVQDADDL